ncbi:MAG: MarR family transcriptional regulator [Acidobacteria bacterium]|nr:MarR family transcriptional regulator [Acidobacteriota bacterium]
MSKSRTAPTPDLQRDAEALQAAVADLVRVYQFRDRDKICCHDVSVTQCNALETLVEHGRMRLGELSQRLFLDKSTTSRVVHTLIRKGYVKQQPDPDDGRATALTATAAGRALCARITGELVEQQKALLADLEPRVRTGVVDVVRRLARAADSRFRAGASTGHCSTESCAPAAGG